MTVNGVRRVSAEKIYEYLRVPKGSVRVIALDVVDSTNTYAEKLARENAAEGLVVVAGEQTAGRGRRGRSFYSPEGTGLYMSILLRPRLTLKDCDVTFITPMAAVAACEAIEKVSLKKPGIKWVNDILTDGKKVCGILAEASYDAQTGKPEYVILGVGMNVYPPAGGFPKEIENVAGAILGDEEITADTADAKNLLAAEFINSFMRYYGGYRGRGSSGSAAEDYVEGYRKRSLATGKMITVIPALGLAPDVEKSYGGKSYGEESHVEKSHGDKSHVDKSHVGKAKINLPRKALALGVDDKCRLLVRYEDGSEEALNSGEISIRLPFL